MCGVSSQWLICSKKIVLNTRIKALHKSLVGVLIIKSVYIAPLLVLLMGLFD